jgi:hypothetical protein
MSDLERLLELERRLEALLGDARRDAARLVADAETTAAQRDAAVQADVAAAAAALDQRIEAERAQREAAILAEAERDAARFDAVSASRLETLAGLIVRRVVHAEIPA